jgi:hypothetical protein
MTHRVPGMPDIPAAKREIEVMLMEYRHAIDEAAAFMAAWRARNPRPTYLRHDQFGEIIGEEI